MTDNEKPAKLWNTFTVMPEELQMTLNGIEEVGGTVFSITALFDAKLLVAAYGDPVEPRWAEFVGLIPHPSFMIPPLLSKGL